MKVTIDSKKGLKTNLKVFVEKETIEQKINVRLSELSKTINLKGFRPGKVPVDVLKRQFSKAIYGEVLEKILQETSSEAIEKKNIKTAGQPKLDLKSYGEGKDLSYTLEIDELPKIKLKPIEEIRFIDYEIEVTQKEINQRIDEIAKNQNSFKDKDENLFSENGDLIIFDYKATIDNKKFEGGEGKNTQIILGKDLFIKGFDKQLTSVKKNQEKEVIANLPENFPKKDLANKKAKFICKITNIKIPEKIEVNDKFAHNLGAKNILELKEKISKQIKTEFKNTLDTISKKEILDQIESSNDFLIPENLIEQEMSILNSEIKKEDIEKNKKTNLEKAKKRIKIGLILNELGEKNNLKVTEDELKDEIQKQIQLMPAQAKQVVDFYQKNPSAALNLKGNIYEEKIVDLIKKKAKSRQKKISIEEAKKIILNQTHDKKHTKLKKTPGISTKKKIRKK